MEMNIVKIEPYTDSPKFEYMWVTVSVSEDTESRPCIKGEIKVPIKKQDITISNLENLVFEKVKSFLS